MSVSQKEGIQRFEKPGKIVAKKDNKEVSEGGRRVVGEGGEWWGREGSKSYIELRQTSVM